MNCLHIEPREGNVRRGLRTPRFLLDSTKTMKKGVGMSLIVACKNKNGIVLAADSKSMDMDANGEFRELRVRRLVQLSRNAAILAGGAAEGESMALSLKSFTQSEGLSDIQDVYGGALPFLASEYDRYMRKACERLPLDPIHQIHFILAGYTEKDPENPYRLYLIWTKKKLPQLDGDEITLAFAVPRIMKLEYTLNRLCRENTGLDFIRSEIQKSLEKQAETQEEIGPPFHFAYVTEAGFQKA
jgi:hypothetical protein